MSQLSYYTDQELPGIPFEWQDYDGSIIDFSSGWTFTVKLVREGTTVATQTASITGSNSSPNVILSNWTAGTLASISSDLSSIGKSSCNYQLRLYARRAADAADDVLRPGSPPLVAFTVAAS